MLILSKRSKAVELALGMTYLIRLAEADQKKNPGIQTYVFHYGSGQIGPMSLSAIKAKRKLIIDSIKPDPEHYCPDCKSTTLKGYGGYTWHRSTCPKLYHISG
jgi:ribosomal protein L37AE/L43A